MDLLVCIFFSSKKGPWIFLYVILWVFKFINLYHYHRVQTLWGKILYFREENTKKRKPWDCSWKSKASLSGVTSSPCVVLLCMARVDVCLYVLPHLEQVYGFVCVCTTWCLYRLEYSVNRFPHPITVHT